MAQFPFGSGRSLTERLLGFAGALLVLVIATTLVVSLLERYWLPTLIIVIVITAAWVVVRIWRARSRPWQ